MNKIGDLLDDSITLISFSAKGTPIGIPTGFEEFDNITNGLQASELMIIASRPGMGKTSFAISMTRNSAVEFNVPVGFISLEMSEEKLVQNYISQETGFPADKLKKGNLELHEWALLDRHTKKFYDAPLFLVTPPRLAIDNLIETCGSLVKEHGVKYIVIDYLQLIDPVNFKYNLGNREQEISMIVRVLKQTARELDISIVLLSQLSRAIEVRGGSKRPLLSDLRDSGAIEDHADLVTFIYRPEYYKIDEWDDEEREPSQGQAELVLGKHKNGRLANIRLIFNVFTGKFDKIIEHVSPFVFENEPFDEEDRPF